MDTFEKAKAIGGLGVIVFVVGGNLSYHSAFAFLSDPTDRFMYFIGVLAIWFFIRNVVGALVLPELLQIPFEMLREVGFVSNSVLIGVGWALFGMGFILPVVQSSSNPLSALLYVVLWAAAPLIYTAMP
jgi:hypothetical protein